MQPYFQIGKSIKKFNLWQKEKNRKRYDHMLPPIELKNVASGRITPFSPVAAHGLVCCDSPLQIFCVNDPMWGGGVTIVSPSFTRRLCQGRPQRMPSEWRGVKLVKLLISVNNL